LPAECLLHVALAAGTALSWLGLGSLLLGPVGRSDDATLDALNRLGGGALAFGLLTFAAGWVGLLYRAAYLPVLVLTAGVGIRELWALRRGVRRPLPLRLTWWEGALVGVIGVYCVLAIVLTCAPISNTDALLYHAADPRMFAGAHEIVEVPWNWTSYQPYTVEMLVLDGFLLWDSVQGAFAPLLLALASLVAVMAASSRIIGRRGAIVAGAVYFAQPLMLWEATSVFVEASLAFAVALASWNAARYVRHGERTALVLAGAFAGGAAGMKYAGIAAAAAIGVAGAAALGRRLRAADIAVYVLAAAVVALPWYVKNAVLTGNPVYPFIFGGIEPQARANIQLDLDLYGYGHGVGDAIALPFRLLANGEAFGCGKWLSPLFVMFAPAALLRRRERRAVVAASLGVGTYVGLWFVGSQQERFLVVAMPVAAVIAAIGLLELAGRHRIGGGVAAATAALALAGGLAMSVEFAARFVPVVVGAQSEREFLEQRVSSYTGIEWVNRNLPPDSRVLTDDPALLYYRPTYVSFGTHGEGLGFNAGPVETRAYVRRTGATHAAVVESIPSRVEQMRFVRARLIARVPIRIYAACVRGHGVDFMRVYALPTAPRPSRAVAAPGGYRPALAGRRFAHASSGCTQGT